MITKKSNPKQALHEVLLGLPTTSNPDLLKQAANHLDQQLRQLAISPNTCTVTKSPQR